MNKSNMYHCTIYVQFTSMGVINWGKGPPHESPNFAQLYNCSAYHYKLNGILGEDLTNNVQNCNWVVNYRFNDDFRTANNKKEILAFEGK